MSIGRRRFRTPAVTFLSTFALHSSRATAGSPCGARQRPCSIGRRSAADGSHLQPTCRFDFESANFSSVSLRPTSLPSETALSLLTCPVPGSCGVVQSLAAVPDSLLLRRLPFLSHVLSRLEFSSNPRRAPRRFDEKDQAALAVGTWNASKSRLSIRPTSFLSSLSPFPSRPHFPTAPSLPSSPS